MTDTPFFAPWIRRLAPMGFRTAQTVVRVCACTLSARWKTASATTWLDPQAYPAQEILAAYLRRWRLEMCLDDLKTTLQMESLRSRSPEMAQQELWPRLIAHNLVRCAVAQAAVEYYVPLERVSFKGSLESLGGTARNFFE